MTPEVGIKAATALATGWASTGVAAVVACLAERIGGIDKIAYRTGAVAEVFRFHVVDIGRSTRPYSVVERTDVDIEVAGACGQREIRLEVEVEPVGIGEVEGVQAGMEVGWTAGNQRKSFLDVVAASLKSVVYVLVLSLLDD